MYGFDMARIRDGTAHAWRESKVAVDFDVELAVGRGWYARACPDGNWTRAFAGVVSRHVGWNGPWICEVVVACICGWYRSEFEGGTRQCICGWRRVDLRRGRRRGYEVVVAGFCGVVSRRGPGDGTDRARPGDRAPWVRWYVTSGFCPLHRHVHLGGVRRGVLPAVLLESVGSCWCAALRADRRCRLLV